MKVIIPVAGKGTRMRPFTHTTPKSMLPVAGKPVIDHILEKVAPLKPTEIVFVTGHLKGRFEEYIKKRYPKLKCSFVEQKTQLGTADAIWSAKRALDSDVLIIFSDTIFDTDLSVIKKTNDDGIIWAKEVPDPERFGVCVTDKSGHLTKIVEKPKTFVSKLANIGVYYIKDNKALIEGIKYAYKTTPKTSEIYLTTAFARMIERGAKLKVLPVNGWYDTGTTEETLMTNRVLLRKTGGEKPKARIGVKIIPPVAIHSTAIITDSVIGPDVSIGPNVRIENSALKDAIVDEGSKIIKSKLAHAIIGQHVEVLEVEGSLLLGDHSRIGKN